MSTDEASPAKSVSERDARTDVREVERRPFVLDMWGLLKRIERNTWQLHVMEDNKNIHKDLTSAQKGVHKLKTNKYIL